MVELKDAPSNTVPNTTGLPPAFPREGSKLVLENDKVKVWNYTWMTGKPTPMHFHNTEIVVIYLQWRRCLHHPGRQETQINHNPGDIVFNAANRSHSEELVKGESPASCWS